MENKVNIGRILLGGTLAGIVTVFIGFAIHGGVLSSHYMYFQSTGSVLKEPRMMPLQMLTQVLSGIFLAMIYVAGRKHFGAGPKTAIVMGLLVGLVSLPGITAIYSFYNLGGMIPLMTLVGNILECIVGMLVAGALYKD